MDKSKQNQILHLGRNIRTNTFCVKNVLAYVPPFEGFVKLSLSVTMIRYMFYL